MVVGFDAIASRDRRTNIHTPWSFSLYHSWVPQK